MFCSPIIWYWSQIILSLKQFHEIIKIIILSCILTKRQSVCTSAHPLLHCPTHWVLLARLFTPGCNILLLLSLLQAAHLLMFLMENLPIFLTPEGAGSSPTKSLQIHIQNIHAYRSTRLVSISWETNIRWSVNNQWHLWPLESYFHDYFYDVQDYFCLVVLISLADWISTFIFSVIEFSSGPAVFGTSTEIHVCQGTYKIISNKCAVLFCR